MFPTDPLTCIASMTIQIEDKTIESIIMKKEDAKEKYDDAIAGGKFASMMSYAQGDVIRINVGNLLPE